MSEVVHPTYRLKAEVLLNSASLGWSAYLQNQQAFANFSPYYTPDLGETQLNKVRDVLDNFVSAEKERKAVLKELKSQTILVCQQWQLLKRYIQGAYPKRFQASKLKIAGKEYYFKAYRFHFESVMALINDSCLFLNDFKMLLTLENNMPLAFVDEYFLACDTFKILHQKFEACKREDKDAKYERIVKLNQIHKALTEMFNDAKAIFANNKTNKALFTFRQKREHT